METQHHLTVTDYVVLAGILCVPIGIGIYQAIMARKHESTAEYYLGSRKMNVMPVALSMLVTYHSSVFILGYPAEMYIYGSMFWLVSASFMLGIAISAFLLIPMFHPLRISSAFEYLEMRFNSRRVRLVGCAVGIVQNTTYMGIVLYGPSVTLETATGLPVWLSIVVIGIGAMFYTSIGGFRAVIWADVFQSVIMIVGMLAYVIKGIMDIGGLEEMWSICERHGRIKFLEFSADPTIRHTFWGLIIGNSFMAFCMGFNQMVIQRISSLPRAKDAYLAVLLPTPGYAIYGALACMMGLTAFAYFAHKGCDPLAAGYISSPNQVAPFFVMDAFKSLPGMAGLFVGAIFSASLSTLSSGLNSLPTVFWEDFLKPCMPKVTDIKATVIGKILVLVFGGIVMGVAYIVLYVGGPVSQISFSAFGSLSGPVSGIFILSAFFPAVNDKGAIVGCLCGLTMCFWISLGKAFNHIKSPWLPPGPTYNCSIFNNNTLLQPETTTFLSEYTTVDAVSSDISPGLHTFYSISYLWLSGIGVLTTVIVGLLVSYLTGRMKESEVNPMLVFSIQKGWHHCLPMALRKCMSCAYPKNPAIKTDKKGIYYMNTNVIQEEYIVEKKEEEEYTGTSL